METLAALWDLAVHLDRHLAAFVAQHGTWVYALLFAIVFCETGLVVTPFLPGDSLLFVAGALAAAGGMDIAAVMTVLVSAALCGDNTTRNRAGSIQSTSSARARSTSGTAARRSSSRASCRSCGPTSRSSPGSARCPTCASFRSASSARWSG
jgi:hypothetical protein